MKLLVILVVIGIVFSATVSADEEEYIHLPGKNCDDAPPCPDDRPCEMAPPRCNTGNCGTDPVPTCGPKP